MSNPIPQPDLDALRFSRTSDGIFAVVITSVARESSVRIALDGIRTLDMARRVQQREKACSPVIYRRIGDVWEAIQ